jgi:glycosyltransferase involved in cell wall biosynthesis
MRILIVTYHLYPDNTSEGICVAKTARALHDAGHEVVVLTSRNNRLEGDSGVPAVGFLSGVTVHRIGPEPSLVPRWSRPFYSLSRSTAAAPALVKGVLGRAAAIPNLVFACTDTEQAWVAAAARRVVALCTGPGPRFDVVHSRLNHVTSHLAVLAAWRRLGVKERPRWSAHFSDPWPRHLYPGDYQARVGPVSRRRLEGVLDRTLATADSLTFPGERLLRFMLSGTRSVHVAKAHAIPHLGNFWWPAPAHARGARCTLLFTGFLLRQRSPDLFVAAVRRLLDGGTVDRALLRVRFVGRKSEIAGEFARAHGVADVVSAEPPRDAEDVWTDLGRADALLLIESAMDEGIFMPSKLADYLSARRPILALSPGRGTVADYLAGGGGLVADPGDIDAIAAALARMFALWKCGRLDELAPPAGLVERIAPSRIVPAYEAAFRPGPASLSDSG